MRATTLMMNKKGIRMMEMLFSLTPAESKRLIAKAIPELSEVKSAMRNHKILISSGSTTSYVAEELLHIKMEKWKYPCGTITFGRQCQTPDDRIRSFLIDKGNMQTPDETITDYEELALFLKDFSYNDIYIKGANAIDYEGFAGFLLAHPSGGNVGLAISIIAAQGSHFIIPVGLEKMIKSVVEASRCNPGIHKNKYNFGRGCGYLVVPNATIVTEIEALTILIGVQTHHLASGGIGGSEGSVTLLVSGSEQQMDEVHQLIRSIKGEKPLQGWKKTCSKCQFKCSYLDQSLARDDQ